MGKNDRKRRQERQARTRLALLGVCHLFSGQQRALRFFKQANDMIINVFLKNSIIVFLKKQNGRKEI